MAPLAVYEHVVQSRSFVLAALVVARERFDTGRAKEGLEIFFDLLALARCIGREGTYLSKLHEYSQTVMILQALNQELFRIPREQLETFDKRVAGLPPTGTVADVIRNEFRMLIWYASDTEHPNRKMACNSLIASGRSDEEKMEIFRLLEAPEMFRKELNKLRIVYDHVEKALLVSHENFEVERDKVLGFAEENGVLAKIRTPEMLSFRVPMDRVKLQFSMTSAAIQIIIQGESALKKNRDPYGTGPLVTESCRMVFNLLRP